uniref:Caspase-6 n=1 Tax=Eptatretus burgeri TaxID=7764 RepID=A0A8C4QSR1_EPTBU
MEKESDRNISVKRGIEEQDCNFQKPVKGLKTEGTMADEVDYGAANLNPVLEYNMKRARRGIALIFNHENFFWQLCLNQRRGTAADGRNLQKCHSPPKLRHEPRVPHVRLGTKPASIVRCRSTEYPLSPTARLTYLGFEVMLHNDKTVSEFKELIAQAALADHSDADCFICVVMTHGEPGKLFARDGAIEMEELLQPFRGNVCKTLAGKPKIFIIQACRGEKHDEPVPVDEVDSIQGETNKVEIDYGIRTYIPSAADFLMCYSVAEGFFSHRETINGSWYIQDLVKVIQEHGTELEFLEILTLVNRMVAARTIDRAEFAHMLGKKQIPCFASMLTRKLYFHPK